MLKAAQITVVVLLLLLGFVSLFLSVIGFLTLVTVGVTPMAVLETTLAALVCYLSLRFAYTTLNCRQRT